MRAEYLAITAMGVVIACAAAGLAILNDDGDDSHEMETHTIEYELDGGENHPSNPKSYTYKFDCPATSLTQLDSLLDHFTTPPHGRPLHAQPDRKSTRLKSSHRPISRMPSSA